MYKISFERCVCFVFLVVFAVFSCSGFRIDNLAMTDISKRNSYTSSFPNSGEFFSRLFGLNATTEQSPVYRHRIRHHRLHREPRAHTPRRESSPKTPSGHIDAIIYQPSTLQPSETLPQIPPNPYHHQLNPTESIITRSQRSSNAVRKPRRRHSRSDLSRWTYLAQIVVHAKVESSRDSMYRFKVIESIKSSDQVDEHIQVNFSNKRKFPSKEYLLFLKATGAHHFESVFEPQLIKRKGVPKIVRKIASKNFKPTPARVVSFKKIVKKKRIKLTCEVEGLPIPNIIFRLDGKEVQPSNNNVVKYISHKRNSTLILKKHKHKTYECIAHGVLNNDTKTPTEKRNTGFVSEQTCPPSIAHQYCLHMGRCAVTNGEPYCICEDGFSGQQCEMKIPGRTYTMPDDTLIDCKLGLATKFNC